MNSFRSPLRRLFSWRPQDGRREAFWLCGPALLLLALLLLASGWATTLAAPLPKDPLWAIPLETIPRPGAQLEITKTLLSPAGGTVAVGETASFRITLRNVSDVNLNRVYVRDDYAHPCLAYLSSTPGGVDNGIGIIIWNDLTIALGDLGPGETAQITVHFMAMEACGEALNRAFASGDYDDGTVAPFSSATASVFVTAEVNTPTALPPVTVTATLPSTPTATATARPLSISKSLISPVGGRAALGDALTYRITIHNPTTLIATRVGLTDLYPANCMSYLSSDPAGTDDGAGRLAWQDLTTTLGDLMPGGTLQVTAQFQAIATCATATNSAQVYGTYASGESIPFSTSLLTVIIDPALPTPTLTPTSTATATPTATSMSDICYAASYPDYAPAAMPDLDQKQGDWFNPDTEAWSHCGPVAAANVLWWLDSKFEPNTIPPPAVIDNFDLVTAYEGDWDDHDPRNVPPLVEDLAQRFDTDGEGTWLEGLYAGVQDFIQGFDLRADLLPSPSYQGVWMRFRDGEAILLLLGFWQEQDDGWRRVGGHYVALAGLGCELEDHWVALSDPFFDRAKEGGPGLVLPAANGTAHNDAAHVSWDLYEAVAAPGPWGAWALSGYGAPGELEDFAGQNRALALEPYQAGVLGDRPIVAVVDYAIAIGSDAPTATPTLTATWASPTPSDTATPTASVTAETLTPTLTATWASPTPSDTATPTPTETRPPIRYLMLIFKRLP